jgi:hypothetical protein
MNRYITVHMLKKSVEEFSDFFNGVASDFAKATVSGAMPARCITTWNAVPHGQTYVFCLWEADKPEDIETSLGEVLDYVTLDTRQVDEVSWAQLAQGGQ